MKVDRNMMYRFFSDENTEEEAQFLGEWLKESPENEEEFRKAYDTFLVSQMFLSSKVVDEVRRNAEKEQNRRRKVYRISAFAAGIAAALAAGFIISDFFFAKPVRELVENSTVVYASLPGQMTSVTLSDGTRVDLNSGSRIEYPAIFHGKERRVRVDGEAIFDVARDEDCPFIVETYKYDIKVLGTRFDVIAEEAEGIFSTALMHGKVALYDKSGGLEYVMSPNTVANLSGGRLLVSELNNEDDYLWPQGIISASGIPFDRLMRKFEKYYNVRIVMEMDEMPEIGYGRLKIRISDGIIKALDILKMSTDFEYRYDTSANVIYINH